MKFPLIGDIATTNVHTVDINSSVGEALDKMLEKNHRNVIVIDGDIFRILTVVDLLLVQQDEDSLDVTLETLNLSKIPVINKKKNILDTLEYINNTLEYICVINDDLSLHGLVTHTDITDNIDPETLMDNYKLSDLLQQESRMKWISKDTQTSDLLKEIVDRKFDNVVVVEDMMPIGIITSKDVMKLIKYKYNLYVPVYEYMSSPVDTIHKNSSIKEALNFIKEKHYKRVIVVDDDGKLSGIIMQKDLISLTYSRWAMLMKEYQEELGEINNMLEVKNKEYETLASKDPLTGLYNRYKFSELYLSSYIAMMQRDNKMSLIMLDIDLFKQVNDTYGHNTGDKVLIEISKILLNTLRNIDIVARWGGEEFIVLLPTASLDNALILSQKLRKSIATMNLDIIIGNISASFGISQVREGEDMQSAIGRADKALYLAKNSGRDCVKTELDS